MPNGKIQIIGALADILSQLRAEKKTIVHCHGVYDLLHVGHIKHLQSARSLGDVLVVTVTPDCYVDKGSHRPAFPQRLRVEALAALGCVDYVAVNDWPTAVEVISLLQPDVYVKGKVSTSGKRDHTDAIVREEEAVKAVGGRLVLTDEETFSASALINQYMDILEPEAKVFLDEFTGQSTAEDVILTLQSIRGLKILAIGETILDEYHFCSVMGKANKDPILAAKYNYEQCYAGGILAIANHLAAFCDDVTVLSFLGELDSREDFVESSLNPKITRRLLRKSGSPTIIKRRFLEEHLTRKLFEIYVMDDSPLVKSDEDELCATLEATLGDYDLVIVADYGHGMLGKSAVSLICEKSKFLALNVQANAGNRGFNTVTRYPRADYISIGEPEARLELRNADADLLDVIEAIGQRMDCPRFIVTRGLKGCVCFDKDQGFQQIPAFAVKVIDRIGAGDALLAISAASLALGTPMKVTGFIANLVGAQACAIMGNQRAIDPASLYRQITSLMQ